MSVAALPLALTAYEGGELFGRLLPLLIGAGLLVAGLVRRSRSADSTEPTPYGEWAPASASAPVAAAGASGGGASDAPDRAGSPPQLEWAVAPAPPTGSGTGMITAGAVLIGIGIFSALVYGAERARDLAETRVERTVVLPEQLLGLPKDAALTEQARTDIAAASEELPPGAQVGGYSDQADVLLVIAAATPLRDLEAEIAAYRGGVEQDLGPIGEGVAVDPGPLGGSARCWSVDFEGTPGHTCVFVDGGSFLSTIDFAAADPQQAGQRGLQARAETVQAG